MMHVFGCIAMSYLFVSFCDAEAAPCEPAEKQDSCPNTDATSLLHFSSHQRAALKVSKGQRWFHGMHWPVTKEKTENNYHKEQEEVKVTMLSSKHFSDGPLILKKSGEYWLTEDITFDPSGPEVMATKRPKPNSEQYPLLDGYYMGFFAAVVIEGQGIILDCKGHEIKMSEQMFKRQRFFSIMELGSKPFISGAGPPQFASNFTSPTPLRSATDVVIKNCVLGKSSHHGIHGNENRGLTLRNLKIRDFEVAGISLNGGSDITIEDCDIGPSLKRTFSAELSFASFVSHLADSLLNFDPVMMQLAQDASIVLRGTRRSCKAIFDELAQELEEYISKGCGKLQAVIGKDDHLPDGSAIYGILLHKTGPAIGDFGACPHAKAIADGHFEKNNVIRNCSIHDLEIQTEQWTRLLAKGIPVRGPGGGVLNFPALVNDQLEYTGNLISDAQLAMGAFKAHALALGGKAAEEAAFYFGGVHIPEEILAWAANDGSVDPGQLMYEIKHGANGMEFECHIDAMSHHNKGAVGLRLEYQQEITLEDIRIARISNYGHDLSYSEFCATPSSYKGKDVRGAIFTNCLDYSTDGIHVDALFSKNGGKVIGVEEMFTL